MDQSQGNRCYSFIEATNKGDDGKKDSAVDGFKHLVDLGCNALGGLIFG